MAHGGNFVLDKGWVVLTTYNTSAAAGVEPWVFVTTAAGDTIDLQTTAAGKVLGVVQEKLDRTKVATGKAVADVRMLGITKVRASAAIAQLDYVTNAITGRAATATTGQLIHGIALSAAAEDGDLIDVLLTPGRSVAA